MRGFERDSLPCLRAKNRVRQTCLLARITRKSRDLQFEQLAAATPLSNKRRPTAVGSISAQLPGMVNYL